MTSDEVVTAWSRHRCQPASIQFPNYECEVMIHRSCDAAPPTLSQLSIFYAKSRVQNGLTTILNFSSMRLQSGDYLPSQHIYITTITSKDSEVVETVWDLVDRSVVRATLTMQHAEGRSVIWDAPQDPLFEYPKEKEYEKRRTKTATTGSDMASVLSLSLRDGYSCYLRWLEGGPTRPTTVAMGYGSSSKMLGEQEENSDSDTQAKPSSKKHLLYRLLHSLYIQFRHLPTKAKHCWSRRTPQSSA